MTESLSQLLYDETLARLGEEHPDFYVWYVPLATSQFRFAWCARRTSDDLHP